MTYGALFTELSGFLGKNLVMVFFIYGLSFFFIAGAVLLGLKALKSVGLARAFFCLFAFSLVHGSVEWVDMYQKYSMALYETGLSGAAVQVRFFLLASSYYFLFLFAFESLTGHRPGMKSYAALIAPLMLFGLLAGGRAVKADAAGMETWIRYLMGLPSALLAAAALYTLSRKDYSPTVPAEFARHMRCAAYLMTVYGLTMLAAPKSGAFISAYLARDLVFQDPFFGYTGVPIQVVRAAVALLISYCMVKAMAMRISVKLAGAFMVFLSMLVISGFAGFLNLKLIVRDYKDVVKIAEEEKDFSYLYKSFNRMYDYVHDPAVSGDPVRYAQRLKRYTGDFENTLGDIKKLPHQDPEEAVAISEISTLYERSFRHGMKDIGFDSLDRLKALLGRVNAMHSRESEEQKALVLKNASNFNRIIFITLFVSFLGAVFIWYAFYRVLILPIKSLRNGARQIADGNLDHRIDLNTADELQEFAAEFNSMGEKLLERTRRLEAVTRELHELSIKDGLTGLYNYRHFYVNLGKEIERAERYGTYLSLLILDVDDFKHYNDTCGHMNGDEVLRGIAEIIGRNLRAADIACRYGGEEFTVILPEADSVGAASTAERTRREIEEHVFPNERSQPLGNVTVSIGVATFPVDAVDPGSLVRIADAALYKAKDEGKNRVSSVKNITPIPSVRP
jgi:diguanylate cyclase (GGDEF)-like protein